ncbi:MAG TPA: ATP-binding protein [Pyrodictium sp.]|nr:ATP-binding protein [Pyrodictium sp.]
MSFKLRISNFKSIYDVELELAPLTVLIGPPASGKSNILDALALLGYLGRHLLLDDEYRGDPNMIEPVNILARFANAQDMFRLQDLSKTVRIGIEFSASDTVEVELYYRQGTPKMKLNGVENSPRTHLLARDPTFVEWIRKSLPSIKRFDVRVYGYERYGLSVRSYVDSVTCGFYRRLKGEYSRSTPVNVLSELAWNVTGIVKKVPWVVPEVNDVVRTHLGEKVELKVLRNGTIAVFDWDCEVDAAYLSDGILRSLYYLLALASSTNYAKLRGLENRLIIGLEEPESHVFPS